MKTLKLLSTLSCGALLVLAGCASAPKQQQQAYAPQAQGQQQQPALAYTPAPLPERKIGGNVPQFVKDAVKNAPEDALVGIGTARMSSTSQSRTFAATRARAEISRQILTLMQDMIRDYTASSEVDPDTAIAYQENFTLALSKSALQGSSVVNEDMDDNKAYWVVVMMPWDGAKKEISQAAAQAKLAVPKAASLDAEKRMGDAFDKLVGQEVQVQDK
jgi:hypothetical protein